MFVSVLHQIKDADTFFSKGEDVAKKAPPNIKPISFLPSEDKKQAVCLWEADSLQSVKTYVEQLTGTSSINTYFPVNAELAMGLPTEAIKR